MIPICLFLLEWGVCLSSDLLEWDMCVHLFLVPCVCHAYVIWIFLKCELIVFHSFIYASIGSNIVRN